jgi:hypothetical protein
VRQDSGATPSRSHHFRYLVEKAFVEGINNGRGGKGSIYVFASGNGAWSVALPVFINRR